MEFQFSEHLEHTKKYAAAFWQHEMLDRPYVAVTAPIKKHQWDNSPAHSFRTAMSGNYAPLFDAFEDHIAKTHYAGEALPVVHVSLSPDQYAAFLGGKIEASSENQTTWVMPCVEDLEDFEVKIDQSENSYYQILKRYLEYGAKRADGKYMLEMLDFHSNMDALSALRSAQELIYDIYDSPEEVHRVLDAINDTYAGVYQMAYDTMNGKKWGTMGWHPIYCEDRAATLQCDFSAMANPDMGREYIFPSIEREAACLDHNIYHLDGKDALCHLDTVLGMDCIDAVQWVPGAGQPRSLEWMDVLKKVQAAGKSLWIFDWTAEEIKAHYKELQPDKVAFTLETETPDEADELLDFLVKNT